MSSVLVLLPHEHATGATEWDYATTPDGRALSDHGRTVAALLPQPRGAGAEVVAVVPSRALAWHRVQLPKGAATHSPRLRSALQGMLEEQLLDEPENLHLAVQPGAHAGDTAWIAVCDRAWLQDALRVLEAVGRAPARIVPEFAPQAESTLTVVGDAEHPIAVTAGPDGVLVLPLESRTLPLLPAEPASVVAEPAVAAIAEQLLQRKLGLQQAPQRWIEAARGRWDLAQFEFASSGRARALKKAASAWGELLHAPGWRPVRWGAAVLLLANLAGLNAYAWKESATLDAKREAVRRTLTETFPNVKVIVDAPIQMEREVAALRQLTGSPSARDLDALLAALAASVPAGRTPSKIEYVPGELRATGLALGSDEARAVISQLRTFGYAGTAQGETLAIVAEDGR